MRQDTAEISTCLPSCNKAQCRKCSSDAIKVVYFEKEGKKFAVCEDCGNVQSIGACLQDRYSKWKQYREVSQQ
jgi:hypothetical protein